MTTGARGRKIFRAIRLFNFLKDLFLVTDNGRFRAKAASDFHGRGAVEGLVDGGENPFVQKPLDHVFRARFELFGKLFDRDPFADGNLSRDRDLFRNHRPGRRHRRRRAAPHHRRRWPAHRRANGSRSSRGHRPARGWTRRGRMHGARLTRTPRRNWPRGRRFRHNRMRIDRLVGTGSAVPPWPLRTHPPLRLRTRWRRGRHLRRLAGNRYSRLRYQRARREREELLPRPSPVEPRGPCRAGVGAPDGWRGGGRRNPSRDRRASGSAGDHGGRDRSGPLERALHDGHGLRCSRRSNRSSGSRGDNGLGRRRRSHHGLARCRLNVRNRAGQRVEVRLKVVQLLQVQPCGHVRRFDCRRRSGAARQEPPPPFQWQIHHRHGNAPGLCRRGRHRVHWSEISCPEYPVSAKYSITTLLFTSSSRASSLILIFPMRKSLSPLPLPRCWALEICRPVR